MELTWKFCGAPSHLIRVWIYFRTKQRPAAFVRQESANVFAIVRCRRIQNQPADSVARVDQRDHALGVRIHYGQNRKRAGSLYVLRQRAGAAVLEELPFVPCRRDNVGDSQLLSRRSNGQKPSGQLASWRIE